MSKQVQQAHNPKDLVVVVIGKTYLDYYLVEELSKTYSNVEHYFMWSDYRRVADDGGARSAVLCPGYPVPDYEMLSTEKLFVYHPSTTDEYTGKFSLAQQIHDGMDVACMSMTAVDYKAKQAINITTKPIALLTEGTNIRKLMSACERGAKALSYIFDLQTGVRVPRRAGRNEELPDGFSDMVCDLQGDILSEAKTGVCNG